LLLSQIMARGGWRRCSQSVRRAERLAAVLPQCASLAVLALDNNSSMAKGAKRLEAVLAQWCPSLAHLELGGSGISGEAAWRLRAAALPSLDLML